MNDAQTFFSIVWSIALCNSQINKYRFFIVDLEQNYNGREKRTKILSYRQLWLVKTFFSAFLQIFFPLHLPKKKTTK